MVQAVETAAAPSHAQPVAIKNHQASAAAHQGHGGRELPTNPTLLDLYNFHLATSPLGTSLGNGSPKWGSYGAGGVVLGSFGGMGGFAGSPGMLFPGSLAGSPMMLSSSPARFPFSSSPRSLRQSNFLYRRPSTPVLASQQADGGDVPRNLPCCGIIHPTYADLLRHYEEVHSSLGLFSATEEDNDGNGPVGGGKGSGDSSSETVEQQEGMATSAAMEVPATQGPIGIQTSKPINISRPAVAGGLFPGAVADLEADLSAFLAREPEGLGDGGAKRRYSAAAFSMGSYTGAELKRFRDDFKMSGVDLNQAADASNQIRGAPSDPAMIVQQRMQMPDAMVIPRSPQFVMQPLDHQGYGPSAHFVTPQQQQQYQLRQQQLLQHHQAAQHYQMLLHHQQQRQLYEQIMRAQQEQQQQQQQQQATMRHPLDSLPPPTRPAENFPQSQPVAAPQAGASPAVTPPPRPTEDIQAQLDYIINNFRTSHLATPPVVPASAVTLPSGFSLAGPAPTSPPASADLNAPPSPTLSTASGPVSSSSKNKSSTSPAGKPYKCTHP
ncbi:hypothetical protein HK104_001778, partial [Borealophlyctis nickersoniae]